MELILCIVVESFCLPTHNIVPHISWHDLPCHRTTKRYSDFPSMVIFQLLLQKFWIQTWFCNCVYNIFAYFTLSLSALQVYMLVLPNQLLCLVLSTSDQYFVPFQPIWCHPHTPIRTVLFPLCTNRHSQFGTFSQTYFNRIFSNCLSHNSPAKRCPYRFLSRGTTGSSILDHDLGICVVVDESKCLDISIFGIFNNSGASSILTWV